MQSYPAPKNNFANLLLRQARCLNPLGDPLFDLGKRPRDCTTPRWIERNGTWKSVGLDPGVKGRPTETGFLDHLGKAKEFGIHNVLHSAMPPDNGLSAHWATYE